MTSDRHHFKTDKSKVFKRLKAEKHHQKQLFGPEQNITKTKTQAEIRLWCGTEQRNQDSRATQE